MEHDKMVEDKILLEKIVKELDKQQIKQLLLIVHKLQKEAP